MVVHQFKTAVTVVKLIPWYQLLKRLRTYRSPKVTIVGPAASGKSTLWRVLYNGGDLIMVSDHRPTKRISGKGALEVTFEGKLGPYALLLRDVRDTPGQRFEVVEDVAVHIASYQPQILVFVLDAGRDFSEPPDRATTDTSKWFDDLRVLADGGDRKEDLRQALRRVRCVILMLNKVNRVYDEIWNANVEKDRISTSRSKALMNIGGSANLGEGATKEERAFVQRIEQQLDTRLSDFVGKSREKVRALFSLAGRNISDTDLKAIPCCLVTYPEKRNDRFDLGHKNMFDVIRTYVVQR